MFATLQNQDTYGFRLVELNEALRLEHIGGVTGGGRARRELMLHEMEGRG